MGIIPKTTPGTFRIIQDFSFPRDNPSIFSVNDDINPDEFQCEWGTFVACVLLIADAPEGTQASVNDVQNAYRNIPIHPDDQPYLVIFFLGLVILDHCAAFGSCSAPGIFGRVADAIVQIFKHYGVQAIIKWVDDFVFWRYPTRKLIDGSFEYSYDESLIFSVAERLGWPWSPTKHTPFSSSFTYNGFQWDIPSRTVELPASKKVKYLERLAPWISGATFTRKECEKMWLSLLHIYLCTSSDLNCSTRGCRLVLFVDASTSWGIGLVANGKWLAWQLKPGWKSDGRDIGWAEMVAITRVSMVL
ncbi:unnamed protein product [Somion occarium]|uniref:Reverse transcriptase domain-containing protein n=1 Tax=Somion occarium TaxID=3059160 RepID=A0ABP1E6M4_9APHY